MNLNLRALRRVCHAATLSAATLLLSGGAWAQSADPAAPPPRTLELLYSQGKLTAGLPDARAANLRGAWVIDANQVAQFELLDETKFGARGGVAAGSYTRNLGPDWYVTGTVAFGRGGPNWAQQRADLDVATKWGATRNIVTHVALNGARYDNQRSDRGLRLAVVAYLAGPTVIEGGVLINSSNPGAVRSQMPYASLTWGREGEQYVSVRVASGREAYQALGASAQLVDFRSTTVGLNWRRWVHRQWGFIVTAEGYRNPTYERRTLGVGLLHQF